MLGNSCAADFLPSRYARRKQGTTYALYREDSKSEVECEETCSEKILFAAAFAHAAVCGIAHREHGNEQRYTPQTDTRNCYSLRD
jgi:hypothetical protein